MPCRPGCRQSQHPVASTPAATSGLLAVIPAHKHQSVYVVKSGQPNEHGHCPPVTASTQIGPGSRSTQGYPVACSHCPESSHVVLFNPDCRLSSTNQAGPRRSLPASASNSSTSEDQMVFDLDGTIRHLTSTQRSKLAQDLSVVETNVNVLNDMLAELSPEAVNSEELHLLQELHQTCRAMHLRVVQFLGQVSDEQVTPSLLQVNENLQSAFLRYKRFEDNRLQVDQTNALPRAVEGSQSLALPPHDDRQAGRRALLAGDPPPLAITSSADDSLINIDATSAQTPATDARDHIQITWTADRVAHGTAGNRCHVNCSNTTLDVDQLLSCLALTPSSQNTGRLDQERSPTARQTAGAGDDSRAAGSSQREEQPQHGRPPVAPNDQRAEDPPSRDLLLF